MKIFFLKSQKKLLIESLQKISSKKKQIVLSDNFDVRSLLRQADNDYKNYSLLTKKNSQKVRSFVPFTLAFRLRLKAARSIDNAAKIIQVIEKTKHWVVEKDKKNDTEKLLKKQYGEFPRIFSSESPQNSVDWFYSTFQQDSVQRRTKRSRSPSPEREKIVCSKIPTSESSRSPSPDLEGMIKDVPQRVESSDEERLSTRDRSSKIPGFKDLKSVSKFFPENDERDSRVLIESVRRKNPQLRSEIF